MSQDLMLDPVVTEDGSTYSREGITGWFKAQTASGKPIRSPLTGEIISTRLVPNTGLRGMVIEWVEGITKKQRKEKEAKGGAETAASNTAATTDASSTT